MKTIWKFPLNMAASQEIEMPLPATPLTVQVQGDTPCLWAEVDDRADNVKVRIAIFGTGHRMPDSGLRYISTIQLGSLVFHAYEITG